MIGIGAATGSAALILLAGFLFSLLARSRHPAATASSDPYWGRLQHAYGDASDLPELFDRMTSDEGNRVWGELWERLCHQGRAGTTASVAAVAPLVGFAGSLPPRDRRDPLTLAGTLVADAGGVLVPDDVRAEFEVAVTRLRDLATETLPFMETSANYMCVLAAVAATEGCPLLAHELIAFANDEIQLECPNCGDYLTIATDAQPWKLSSSQSFQLLGQAPTTAWPSLARYRDLASGHRHERVAAWIDDLRREATCPQCGTAFVIADVLTAES